MFLDVFICRMDEKGRAYMPTKLRKEIKDGLFISGSPSGCLLLRQEDDSEIKIDKYGRVRIAKPLRVYAGLQREVVFVGCGETVEMWAPEKWAEEEKRLMIESSEKGWAIISLNY